MINSVILFVFSIPFVSNRLSDGRWFGLERPAFDHSDIREFGLRLIHRSMVRLGPHPLSSGIVFALPDSCAMGGLDADSVLPNAHRTVDSTCIFSFFFRAKDYNRVSDVA